VHRFDLLGHNRVARETPGWLPDQNGPGRGTRLKPRCGIHCVTDDRSANPGYEYFACGDADPGRERDWCTLVQRVNAVLHVHPGPYGSKRVVLVRVRHTEDRRDRVSDELFDPAPVALDGRAHLGEVALEERAEHLRVVLLAQRCGSHEVTEEGGDQPALSLTRYRQRAAALPAELLRVGVLAAARRAGEHGRKRMPSRGATLTTALGRVDGRP